MAPRSISSNWRLSVGSALLCTLAFNLTFFIQEFFLVVPKALTPGLYPTLFHNNHSWTGHNPVVGLLQGSGALADLASGILFAGLLAKSTRRPVTLRLLLFWMAFQGFFLALPQFVIGAFNPANDVGTAMAWLGLSAIAKQTAALIAVIAMAAIGFWLARQFVRLVALAAETATAHMRQRFVVRCEALPALISVLLLVPFREPRDRVEVLLLPLVVMTSGMLWVQLGAWFAPPATQTERANPALATPLFGLLILLAAFQLVLRPGIRFY